MHSVASFHISAAKPAQINAITAAYLALERARRYRRLFVARFGALALVVGIMRFALHWLPAGGAWSSVGLCLLPPAWAWVAEWRSHWRLNREVRALSRETAAVASSPGQQKVVKRS